MPSRCGLACAARDLSTAVASGCLTVPRTVSVSPRSTTRKFYWLFNAQESWYRLHVSWKLEAADSYRLPTMAQFHNVCKVSDILDGEAKMFVVEETMIGLFHIGGEFYALGDRCPHAGASLLRGDIQGDVVCCRIHHWRFSIRDGKYLDEAKPELNARSYSVRVVGDQVQVEV